MTQEVDYLDTDTILPEGQKYVCLSFLSPDKTNKTTLSAIKIRGVFPDYDSACEHAKKVQKVDPYFNVFVGDVGSWLPYDPNPDSEYVKNNEYANQELNKMMKAYKENQEQAKIFHEQRKNEKVRDNIKENLLRKKENQENLKNKLKDSKDKKEINDITFNLESLDKQIKEMEAQQKSIEKKIKKQKK